MQSFTTIAAIATAMSPAAVGVIRLSGPEALSIADRVFFPRGAGQLSNSQDRTVRYGTLRRQGQTVDDALALILRGPRSYTGEDTVEFSCHGGTVVLREVLLALTEAGAVLAQPGEFTKRAYLNGKLDLMKAEAITDLIYAKSARAARLAAQGLEGAVSGRLRLIRERLLDVDAQLLACVDFPEEEIEELEGEELLHALISAKGEIERLLHTFEAGRAIKDGIPAAIIGRPNVGKSSVLNLLSGEDRAIVSDTPGTTRDVLAETVRLGELLLNLSDTAGIRLPEHAVEAAGIERAVRAAGQAELLLCVFDASRPLQPEDQRILELAKDRNAVALLNKCDLPRVLPEEALTDAAFVRAIPFSAVTGEGLDVLTETLSELYLSGHLPADGEPMIASLRHRDGLVHSRDALVSAVATLQAGLPADIAELDVAAALLAIDELTGRATGEDLLARIFSRFCIGK